MDRRGRSTLAGWLATPDRVAGLQALAEGWRDMDCTLLLAPVAPVGAGFGANLRRSFLGALAPGASAPARAGRPCPWDPPCALDVFLREQLRAGGDGLPKPYVLAHAQDRGVLAVTLRVFGTACDWFPAASEALVAGLTGILPWDKAVPGQRGAPMVQDRMVAPAPWAEVPDGPVTLHLLSPMDDEGARPDDTRDIAARILSRAIRRVDALARWQGLALSEAALSDLTAQAHAVRATAQRLTFSTHDSPNRHGQTRRTRVMTGAITLPPLSPDMALLLALACRCHIGRHTNEGLGAVAVGPA